MKMLADVIGPNLAQTDITRRNGNMHKRLKNSPYLSKILKRNYKINFRGMFLYVGAASED